MNENDILSLEPPHKQYAEQVVLGATLTDRVALDEALSHLTENDFYDPKHQTVFAAIRAIADKTDGDVTPPMVAQRLETDKQLDNIGGIDYLAALVTASPAASSIGYYIDQLKDSTTQRRVIQTGLRISQIGRTDADSSTVVDLAVSEALALETDDDKNDVKLAYDIAKEMLGRVDEIQQGVVQDGVMTGFRDIDEVTHGLQPDQMIVVAGRPGMGKSTLGMDFARHAALHDGVPTVIFSLEMGRAELMQRLFAAEANIPLNALRDPFVRPGDNGRDLGMTSDRWESANRLWESMEDKPLYIDDSANLTLTDIKAKCRRLQRSVGLQLVVIDYLQLMANSARASENRQQEVSTMSRGIKQLAKQLHVPVVVLSQLNRNSELRGDRKPQLSDLRESGSIEQDADVVFLVHRPDYYDKEDRPGEADVILAKHRNGPTETFPLAFVGMNSRFQDIPKDALTI